MQYLYHAEAAIPQLLLTGDSHRYLFRVRRHRAGERIYLRNLQDDLLYSYRIERMDKKEALLILESQKKLCLTSKRKLHIGWCMIDPKSIEKVLPMLNEVGLTQITFIYCERSQKQFKPDFDRWQKILLNSSQQCGRSSMMHIAVEQNLSDFVAKHPEAYLLDFSAQTLASVRVIETIVIGCEGGMSDIERALFASEQTVGFDTPLILRSESAAVAVASHLLL